MMDRLVFCFVAVFSFALGVLARDVAQDWRDIKKRPAAQAEPAPIWSRNCQKASGFLFATQADGKAWVVRCHQPVKAL